VESGREARVVGRSILDLGPRARVVFGVVYVSVMLVVIAGAQTRPDHVFGFQMFNETSTLNVHLFRRIRGRPGLEPFVNGGVRTRTPEGLQTFTWQDRVRDSVLSHLDTPTHAKYGLAGQLYRLQFALDDFMRFLPADGDTLGLVAVVETTKNGRDAGIVRLKAGEP
jgi:hypothetical protein